MVGRPGKYQPRFTAGQLDPLMQANTDVKAYLTGASLMQNARALPQGGFSQRWGLRQRARVRNQLTAVSAAGATLTALAGTAANAIDGNPATKLIIPGLSGPAILLTVDFGAPITLQAVDIIQFGLSADGGPAPTWASPNPPLSPVRSGALSIDQSVDGVTWYEIYGTTFLEDTLRTRRHSWDPGLTFQARYIRLNAQSIANASTTFYLGDVLFWTESAAPSPVRVRSFDYNETLTYDTVLTAGNIDVYLNGARCAAIPTPYIGSQIATLKQVQQLDAMILFHQDVQPQRIMHQGTPTEWNIDPAPFVNIPNYDFGLNYTNGAPAQWVLEFIGFDAGTIPTGGASYVVDVNGQDSPSIQQSPTDFTGTANALQTAILALPGVSPGVTVVQDAVDLQKFTVTFAGAGNEGDAWAVSGRVVDKADAAITAAHTVQGILGGEPVISTTRGWPKCGAFYGARLLLGGLLSVPNSILTSEVGNFYELNTELVAATAPMLIPLDTAGSETIRDIHLGRTLFFFTDQAQYWLYANALDRTVPPVIVMAGRNGIGDGLSPVENESSTVYPHSSASALFELDFDFSRQNYSSSNMSVMSADLVQDIIDMALRKLTGSTDNTDLYAVCANGSAVSLSLLREEGITSFAPVVTDGQFLAVNVNNARQVLFATVRTVAGQSVQFFEAIEDGLLVDQAVSVTLGAPGTVVTGLSDLEGATVWAIADSYVQGPFVVTGGAITLGFAATQVTVGRWTALDVRTLPQPQDVAPETVVRRPMRVHTVRLKVLASSSVAIGANGEPAEDVGLMRFGGLTDVAPMLAPFTGEVIAEGLVGFSDDGTVQITQLKPGLLTVIAVTVEVDK